MTVVSKPRSDCKVFRHDAGRWRMTALAFPVRPTSNATAWIRLEIYDVQARIEPDEARLPKQFKEVGQGRTYLVMS